MNLVDKKVCVRVIGFCERESERAKQREREKGSITIDLGRGMKNSF